MDDAKMRFSEEMMRDEERYDETERTFFVKKRLLKVDIN